MFSCGSCTFLCVLVSERVFLHLTSFHLLIRQNGRNSNQSCYIHEGLRRSTKCNCTKSISLVAHHIAWIMCFISIICFNDLIARIHSIRVLVYARRLDRAAPPSSSCFHDGYNQHLPVVFCYSTTTQPLILQ